MGQSQYLIHENLSKTILPPPINQSINWSIKMRVRGGGRIGFCPAGDHNNNLTYGRQIPHCWAICIILFLRLPFILTPFSFLNVLINGIASKHASVLGALKPGVRNRRSCVRRPGEWHHSQTAMYLSEVSNLTLSTTIYTFLLDVTFFLPWWLHLICYRSIILQLSLKGSQWRRCYIESAFWLPNECSF